MCLPFHNNKIIIIIKKREFIFISTVKMCKNIKVTLESRHKLYLACVRVSFNSESPTWMSTLLVFFLKRSRTYIHTPITPVRCMQIPIILLRFSCFFLLIILGLPHSFILLFFSFSICSCTCHHRILPTAVLVLWLIGISHVHLCSIMCKEYIFMKVYACGQERPASFFYFFKYVHFRNLEKKVV